MRRLALLCLLCACTRAPDVHNHDASAPEIAGLQRQGGGAYAPGATETFKLVYSVDSSENPQIDWSASAGALTASGDQVTWTLPGADEATLTASLRTKTRNATTTFRFRLAGGQGALTSASAAGVIDSAPTGSACDLAINPSNNPVVIYRNDQHPSIWYAVWSGTAWQTELVDGMGYEVGGTVDWPMRLTLASDGTPHIVYALENRQLWYATKSGGAWTRERVDTTISRSNPYQGEHVGIALDPAHGNRPTISYTSNSSSVVIAARTGANTWSNTSLAFSGTTYTGYALHQGGLAIDASGLVYVTFYSGNIYFGSWNGSATAIAMLPGGVLLRNGDGPTPLGLDAAGKLVAMEATQVTHLTLGSGGLTNATSKAWPFEENAVMEGDLAIAGNTPHMVYGHPSGGLELVQPDANGYWVYTQGGQISNSTLVGAAVDQSGATHACYQLNGKINYQ